MQADDWTPEQSQALRDQVTRGISFAKAAAEINARFGTSYTRNAAIGRGRRMGLVGAPRPTPAKAVPERANARHRAVPRHPKPTIAPACGHSALGTAADLTPAHLNLALGTRELGTRELGTRELGTAASGAPAPGHQSDDTPATAAPVQLRCVGISPRLVSFAELEPCDCRYPYGCDKDNEPIAFCGHPRRDGSSYCAPHFHLTRVVSAEAERAVGPITLRLVLAA